MATRCVRTCPVLGTLRAARRPKGPLSACALWPPSDGLRWPRMASDPCKPPMPQVRTLPCLHTFHSGCAEEWLKKKKVCPLCNFPIDGTAEQGDGGTAQAAGGGSITS